MNSNILLKTPQNLHKIITGQLSSTQWVFFNSFFAWKQGQFELHSLTITFIINYIKTVTFSNLSVKPFRTLKMVSFSQNGKLKEHHLRLPVLGCYNQPLSFPVQTTVLTTTKFWNQYFLQKLVRHLNFGTKKWVILTDAKAFPKASPVCCWDDPWPWLPVVTVEEELV